MTNPFEDKDANYHVLMNDEGQYSLWPIFVEIPSGWTIILNSNNYESCIKFIEENWIDMRPISLTKEMQTPN
jgi:MbtH protein